MKKITIFIDEELLQNAIKTTGAKSKKEVIEKGLRELIRQHNKNALQKEMGTFEIDLTLDELERLRNAE